MLSLLGEIKQKLKFRGNEPKSDTTILWLHYRLTAIILWTCCIMVTAKEYIGSHIECLQDNPEDGGDIPNYVLNTYCFITTTFSVPKHFNKVVGRNVAHYGVGPYTDDNTIKYHAYYQWVPFVIFLQGVLFYVPRILWKIWEGGKLKTVILGLNTVLMRKDERESKQHVLGKYFVDNISCHGVWAYKLLFCQFLCLLNIIGNIFFTDLFLGREFTTYGVEVVQFLEMSPEQRTDPMSRVFPKVTKCTFHKFGSSGTIEKRDALCVLAVNIITEKIYTFLWFWFIILSVLTAIGLLYSFLVMLLDNLKILLLKYRSNYEEDYNIRLIIGRCHYGDWVLLYSLCCNMDSVVCDEFITELAAIMGEQMEYKSKNEPTKWSKL